ncbi:hypothetical protein GCM10023152_01770 [Agromyces bauzanensis]|uniref:Uncharacterized protein n=1 Tax=Agromyces bauzanensis TaxID=1308924 RepID=A0A917PF24_9MICO|nr:hypothetical protein GCM10011372_10160 [Agromyces bauzanensis]
MVPQLPLLHPVRASDLAEWVKPGSPSSGESKHERVRYLDLQEDDEFDDGRIAIWIRQAADLPGDEL